MFSPLALLLGQLGQTFALIRSVATLYLLPLLLVPFHSEFLLVREFDAH
jgi:hypothetical protein